MAGQGQATPKKGRGKGEVFLSLEFFDSISYSLPANGGDMASELKQQATMVRERAYAPYSKFKVGAAIRGASGAVYAGCNVENAAYPEGTCAEAGAIAAMVAAGETKLTEAYVIAGSDRPVPPCGGCRQKLAEFGAGDVPITLATTGGVEQQTTLAELLPGAFDAAFLEE